MFQFRKKYINQNQKFTILVAKNMIKKKQQKNNKTKIKKQNESMLMLFDTDRN